MRGATGVELEAARAPRPPQDDVSYGPGSALVSEGWADSEGDPSRVARGPPINRAGGGPGVESDPSPKLGPILLKLVPRPSPTSLDPPRRD